jgi:hypothetical protein
MPAEGSVLKGHRHGDGRLWVINVECAASCALKWNSPGLSPACYGSSVETIGQLRSPPLASRLGDVVHESPLLRKICQASGCSADRVGQWLLKCAVLRGASHYEREFPEDLPPDCPELSDEELGVALCLGQHPYNSTLIRAAAQLLSSPQTDAPKLVKLAVMERAEPVLSHIAALAARFAPDAQPWLYLRRHLPQRLSIPPDALPHWSRFVSQIGVASFAGGPDIKWLRRREPAP